MGICISEIGKMTNIKEMEYFFITIMEKNMKGRVVGIPGNLKTTTSEMENLQF